MNPDHYLPSLEQAAQLIEQAGTLGIYADAIKKDLPRSIKQATQEDYKNAAKPAIQTAIQGSDESRSQDSGQGGTEAGWSAQEQQAAEQSE
jgi:hypothetical protein